MSTEVKMRELEDIIQRLRGEDGCPWDRQQTLDSLKPHLIEESYELAEAIDSGDPERHKDELGDLLLQVVLQAQIRREQAAFTLEDVAAHLSQKLIRRHPHVFGDVKVRDAGDVLRNWETIKAREQGVEGPRPLLSGLPRHLPALQRAQKVQARVARMGFDWPEVEGVLAKVEEELAEIRTALQEGHRERIGEEAGDLLFTAVNLCRFLKINAELTLDKAVSKFVDRFQAMEQGFLQSGRRLQDATPDELNAAWEAVKLQSSDGSAVSKSAITDRDPVSS